MASTNMLGLLDQAWARGQRVITSAWLAELTGQSPQAATNALRRLTDEGLLEKVSRGRYLIRPFGLLGTSAASEDPALIALAVFPNGNHRVAYRSALDYWGLVTRPSREIQVATTKRVRRKVSGVVLHGVVEAPTTLHLGAERTDSGAWVSTQERAVLESAARPDLVGSLEILAEAVVMADVEPPIVAELADQLDMWPGARRLASLSDVVGREEIALALTPPKKSGADIDLDPSLPRSGLQDVLYRDDSFGVRWHISPEEIEAVSGS